MDEGSCGQALGSLGLIARRLPQRSLEKTSLQGAEIHSLRMPAGHGLCQVGAGLRRYRTRHGEREMVDTNRRFLAPEHGALDDVAQFADIARPGIELEVLTGFISQYWY